MDFVETIRNFPDFIGSGGRTDREIDACEKALNLRFSEEYRTYLKKIGLACFDGTELTGITAVPRLDVAAATKKAKERNILIPEDLYVVEDTGIDGILVWQSSAGEVFLSAPGTALRKAADSLTEYYTHTPVDTPETTSSDMLSDEILLNIEPNAEADMEQNPVYCEKQENGNQ